MERCPTCQAQLREPPVCGRCQTDLSRSIAAEQAAGNQLRIAIEHWAAGDLPAARQAVERSLLLKREPLAIALRGLLMTAPSVNPTGGLADAASLPCESG